MTVLALTVGGSVVAMQQQARAAKPQMVCRGGQCRLVQPQTAALVAAARGAIAPAAVAGTSAVQGKYTVGVTPAQQAAQKEQFGRLLQGRTATTAPVRGGVLAPAAVNPATQSAAERGFQAIPVPR